MSDLIDVIDVRGTACPIPVVRTRKAMMQKGEQVGGTPELTVLVSKPDQVDNVTRMAERSGWKCASVPAGDHFRIIMTGTAGSSQPVRMEAEDLVCKIPAKSGRIAIINSETMGEGSETLGGVLIRAFLGVLKELENRPETVIFYNSGVKLTVTGSPVLEELRELDELGITLLVCGTCLDYYELKDKIAVGTISNMFDIASAMLDAGNTVVI